MNEIVFPTMGTVARVQWENDHFRSGECQRLLSERCLEIERKLSRFREDSELSHIGWSWQQVSHDTRRVLCAALSARRDTAGFFSPFRGGSSSDVELMWQGCRVRMARHAGGGERRADGRYRSEKQSVSHASALTVDLGGIAKGFAADELRDLLAFQGVSRGIVSIGSSSQSFLGDGHRVGVASPWMALPRAGVLTTRWPALSVSALPGTALHAGQRVSHLWDPTTGEFAMTDLAQVLVACDDGMRAEVFSTAFLAMGEERAKECAEHHHDLDIVFFTVDGRIEATPGVDFALYHSAHRCLSAQ